MYLDIAYQNTLRYVYFKITNRKEKKRLKKTLNQFHAHKQNK